MKDAGVIKVPVLKKTESKVDGTKKGKPAAGERQRRRKR
jgi:hypothetical protein